MPPCPTSSGPHDTKYEFYYTKQFVFFKSKVPYSTRYSYTTVLYSYYCTYEYYQMFANLLRLSKTRLYNTRISQ